VVACPHGHRSIPAQSWAFLYQRLPVTLHPAKLYVDFVIETNFHQRLLRD